MNSIRTIPSRLATSASEHPGQGFLFPHRLHRSDTLDVADRSAIPECQQPDQGTPDQFRRFSLSFFGPKAPPGKENNWVQTIPGKGQTVILRLYGPIEPWFAKKWRPGEIER
jgi:hypothetical protein